MPDKGGHLLIGTSGILSVAGSHNTRSKLTFDKIIHSSDEADYVGLPPTPCDYVLNVGLYVDFSGGQNPFPVMAGYQWSISGASDEPAYATSSSNSSLAQISSGSFGDVVTLSAPNDGQQHFVSISTPPINATSCAACSRNTFNVTSASITLKIVVGSFGLQFQDASGCHYFETCTGTCTAGGRFSSPSGWPGNVCPKYLFCADLYVSGVGCVIGLCMAKTADPHLCT